MIINIEEEENILIILRPFKILFGDFGSYKQNPKPPPPGLVYFTQWSSAPLEFETRSWS